MGKNWPKYRKWRVWKRQEFKTNTYRKITNDLFIGIPLTSTIKNDDYFHAFTYDNKQNGLTQNSAMILQLKVLSIKRLMNKIGIVNKEDFETIIEKSKNLISPT